MYIYIYKFQPLNNGVDSVNRAGFSIEINGFVLQKIGVLVSNFKLAILQQK